MTSKETARKRRRRMRKLRKKKGNFPTRFAALVGGSLLLILALSLINLSPSLSHLDANLASGPETGNYYEVAARLETSARLQEGTLGNRATKGSVDNLNLLVAEKASCNLHFAIVQDGIVPDGGHGLELIARLPKSESVFILGTQASTLGQFEDMRNLRVGVGPQGSGTDHLARAIFESDDFSPLGLRLQNFELGEQLEALKLGSLDLAIFVLDEDAKLIRNAMREGLQMASFDHLDVIARNFDFMSYGRIGAGQFDPIAVIPTEDRKVLRVDTMVVGNKCASRTETMALISLLQREFPTLIEHNRGSGGSPAFPTSAASHTFIVNGGPEWADTHVPWLVDIMPISNWFYVIMAISILFNVMTSGHKFRLWRIDANRDRAQQVFRDLLGEHLTPAEIDVLEPQEKHLDTKNIAKLDDAIAELDDLRKRCRAQENSPLVPMGQELAYRYQEEQMEIILTAVRRFRDKIDLAQTRTSEDLADADDA